MGVKKLMMARMLMNAEEMKKMEYIIILYRNVLKVFLRPVFPDETLAK